MSTKPVTQDDYLLTIGEVVQNSVIIDICLFSAFHIISGCDLKIARAIYFTLDAQSAKENLVNRVAKQTCGQKEHDDIEGIIKAAKLANKKRNELVHAIMLNSSDDTLARYYPRHPTQPIRKVTRAYLASMLQPTSDAVERAMGAFDALCQKRGVPALLQSGI